MSREVLVRAEGVSKKFASRLNLSMWYGAADIARDFFGLSSRSSQLRAGEFWAVDDLSFELGRGECWGLIGPNGAGKSTLLKMLNGIILPDQGRIEIQGRLGALIELGAGFHPLLTGRENIYINGAILGLTRREMDANLDSIIAFSELEDFMDTPIKFYSSGMYVRLGFAIAAHLHPDILLLDEVLAVGDVSFQAKCFNKLGQIRDAGATVFLVSHNLHHVAGFCQQVAYLNRGVLKFIGDPGEAIATYTADLLERSVREEPGDGSDLSQVHGSGRIKIEDVRFLDAGGNPVSQIHSGEGVTVRLVYCSDGTIENPLLDVAIRDTSPGNLFQATNRDFHADLSRLGRKGYIDLTFKSLNSNNQVLDFFFTFWNSERTELFDWKRHLKLWVGGNPLSSGRMMWDCEWRNVVADDSGQDRHR